MVIYMKYWSIQVHVTRPKKGGCVSYVHSSLEYTVLSEMSIITEHLECVFIEVNTRIMTQNKKIIVGIVYRPPYEYHILP